MQEKKGILTEGLSTSRYTVDRSLSHDSIESRLTGKRARHTWSCKSTLILATCVVACLALVFSALILGGMTNEINARSSGVPYMTFAIDTTGQVGQYTSIATGPGNTVHISYYDVTNQDLKYATNASGSWTTETVDSYGDVGKRSSIAVDSNGKAHIVYYDSIQADVKYATNSGGSWTSCQIENWGTSHSSIAVDYNGFAHISYMDVNNDLYYAHNKYGYWDKLVVRSSVYDDEAGYCNKIAVDSDGYVHFSYLRQFENYGYWYFSLEYTTNVGGSYWNHQCLASWDNSDYWGILSMDLDSTDKAHICHFGPHDGYRATWHVTNAGGTWAFSRICDDIGELSIAVDSNGAAHVSRYDTSVANDDYLEYHTNAGGSWSSHTIDASSSSVGGYNSIAVDAADHIHISYYDSSNSDLKYATDFVYEPPDGSLTVTSPAKGSIWDAGKTCLITWDSTPGVGLGAYVKIEYDFSYYSSPVTIANQITNDGEFYWSIPYFTDPRTDYFVRVSSKLDPLIYDDSDFFTIREVPIMIISQSAGIVAPGENLTIEWLYTATAGDYVKIEYDHTSYSSPVTIASSTENDGYFRWPIPLGMEERSDYFIRVSSVLNPSVYDDSRFFAILTLNQICVTSPTMWPLFTAGDTCQIEWTCKGTVGSYVMIEYRKTFTELPEMLVTIATSTENDGAYSWVIPYYMEANDYSIKVTSTEYPSIFGWSSPFRVEGIAAFSIHTLFEEQEWIGEHSSIALDSNGSVHISYYDREYDTLGYATNSAGEWASYHVVPRSCVGQGNSIAVDSQGHVHIGYVSESLFDPTDRGIKYVTNAGGDWTAIMIDYSAYPVGIGGHSIALDSNDSVHMVYGMSNGTSGSVKYATNAGGSWRTEIVDPEMGGSTSIALDSDGKVHVTYTDGYVIKYGTNSGGIWTITTIDSEGHGQSSIAIDSNDNVHVAYSLYDGWLRYATNAEGSWVTSSIADMWCHYLSLALDSNDKVHIAASSAYPDYDLFYVTDSAGEWAKIAVDTVERVGEYCSIAVASNDRVHISYYNQTAFSLGYATNWNPPTARAEITPDPVMALQEVTFDASGSTCDGTIVNWTWSFWDEGHLVKLYGEVVVYVFVTELQDIVVNLTVRGADNVTDSCYTMIHITGTIPEFPSTLAPILGIAVLLLCLRQPLKHRRKKG